MSITGLETRQFEPSLVRSRCTLSHRFSPARSFSFARVPDPRRRKKRHEARARTNERTARTNDPNVIPPGTRVGMRKCREPLNLFRPGRRGDFASSWLRLHLRQTIDQTFNQQNLRVLPRRKRLLF